MKCRPFALLKRASIAELPVLRPVAASHQPLVPSETAHTQSALDLWDPQPSSPDSHSGLLPVGPLLRTVGCCCRRALFRCFGWCVYPIPCGRVVSSNQTVFTVRTQLGPGARLIAARTLSLLFSGGPSSHKATQMQKLGPHEPTCRREGHLNTPTVYRGRFASRPKCHNIVTSSLCFGFIPLSFWPHTKFHIATSPVL